ncbi:MAG TPA: class I SAM-dependent methyltransferase [Mycobacterium sp.]|nr:class I SAM-dependent methyltransferase [Mycobacterium sp.]
MLRTASETLDKVGAQFVYRIGSTAIYKKVFRHWYSFMTRRLSQDEDVVFLNWGYEEDPPMGLTLDAADEPNRYSIQLYHQTATQADIAGKKVLEVSCGHGGGASYLTRALQPASYTGLDFNAAGVEFCQGRHKLPGLDFVHGDAENLPFPDASFDAVVNVEASHIYPHFERFLAEVARVLRPGGHFLYADFRNRDAFGAWEQALANSGMRVVTERVINTEVLRGLKKNSPRSNELIERRLPPFLRRFGREFAVVDGSWFYNDLERGEIDYRSYHLVKE